jgi:ubiquinone/menaquinone biosynthesis C-methylase UbiE
MMAKEKINIKELGYYDFLAHIGISFFNWGGIKATEELIEMCNINEKKKVLIVGCGSGYQACQIAQKYGSKVVGIDIAEHMVKKSKERAEELGLENEVEFHVGDALDIPFKDNSFDIVISEFVTIFIDDKKKAFSEYARVVKPGGFVGINEIYREENAPAEVLEKLEEVTEFYERVTGLVFPILTPSEWQGFFEGASLSNIELRKHEPTQDVAEMVSSVGGKWKFTKISFKVLYYTMTRGKLGKDLRDVGRVKSRFRASREHIGYALCVGKKK